MPHSSRNDNPEGLLELEIKNRARSQAGVTAKYKKRHLKQIPPAVRDKIVSMYLDHHVFQKDIAKVFKISAAMVSRLVKEAQENPEKNENLKLREEKNHSQREAIKKVVHGKLEQNEPI